MKYNHLKLFGFVLLLIGIFVWPQYRYNLYQEEVDQAREEVEQIELQNQQYAQEQAQNEALIQKAIEEVGVYATLITRKDDSQDGEEQRFGNIVFQEGYFLPGNSVKFDAWGGSFVTICNESPERGDLVVTTSWGINEAIGFLTKRQPCLIINGNDLNAILNLRRPQGPEGTTYPSRWWKDILNPVSVSQGDLAIYQMPKDPMQMPTREIVSRLTTGNETAVQVMPDHFVVILVSANVPNPSFQVAFQQSEVKQEIAMTNRASVFPDAETDLSIYRLK